MQRRSFLKKASLGAVAGTATVAAPVFAQDAPTFNWRLASSFPKTLDTLYGASEQFAKYINEGSGGKFTVRTFPAGEIVPPLAILDAVQKNTIEMGHTPSYYYFGKDPILCFDTAVPFGLNARQTMAWMYDGDGMKLMRDVFKSYDIVNFPMGNTGVQMGGWFRKEIKAVADLKGLKMRTAGFAGDVLSRLGVIPQQLAAGDIYPALEKGTLDAVEFVGPYDDQKFGFAKVAKHYYYPGWWEAGAQVSLYINAGEYQKLPESYKTLIDAAARATNVTLLARYDNRNALALKTLISQGAVLHQFPRPVLEASWDAANLVYAELCAKDPKFKAVFDSYMGYRDAQVPWFRVAEGSYDSFISSMLAKKK